MATPAQDDTAFSRPRGPSPASVTVYVLAALLVAAVLWAALGSVDVRVAGRGTWPTPAQPSKAEPPMAQGAPTRLTGLMGNIVSVSRHTTVKVLDWRVVDASASVAQALQLAPGDKVRKAVRRRSSLEGPLSYITTYIPEHLAAGFGRSELALKPVLQLLEESGVELGRARQTISARQADALVAVTCHPKE